MSEACLWSSPLRDEARGRGWSTHLVVALVLAGCASFDDGTIPTGKPMALPASGSFPAQNLIWIYAVTASPDTTEWLPEQIALCLESQQEHPYRWGYWRYGAGRGIASADLSFESDEVWLSEPCLDLAVAPHPVVNLWRTSLVRARQRTATAEDLRCCRLPGDKGSLVYSCDAMRETTSHGQCSVAVPAGRFDDAWYSTSRFTPESAPPDSVGWECSAWWVNRVGFVRIQWTGPANRRVLLDLVEIRR